MSKSPREKRGIAQSEAQDLTGKFISSLVGLGPAYELITKLIVPLHEKKKREFINDLASRLNKLEKGGEINFEELAENEEFNTIITKAILLAQQNHQKEKLEALRNVVLNAAAILPNEVIEFDSLDYFMSIIERVSPLHLHILYLLQDNRIIASLMDENIRNTLAGEAKIDLLPTPKTILFYSYPHLKEKSEMIAVCWKDLMNFSLVKSIPFEEIVTDRENSSLVTELGDQFLKMIESRE